MKDRSALLGSLGAAVLASACCLGPLALGALGLGSLGAGAALAPLRPWLLLVTAVLLAVAFYFAYRPIRKPDCGPDGECARLPSRSTQRLVLWVVTVLTVALATYPTWGARLLPRSQSVMAASANDVVVLAVAGMTCAACEGEVEHELLQVPGVLGARVDYPSGRAEIQLGAAAADVAPLIAAVKRAGYDASPAHPGASAGGAAASSALAGQWRGQLVVGDGKTSELIVDLGVVGDRWAGQFDLHDFGVEDYPVDVAIDGQLVTLHLSAAKIDFEGLLAGDVLAGMAKAQGGRDSLVLKRTGEAHFTDDFLALEKVADDPTRLEPLSGDAAVLRKRFNDDREYTRLVMLLSPS